MTTNYEQFSRYSTKQDEYLLKINQELENLNIRIRVPIYVENMTNAYNAKALMGVMAFDRNIIFMLRRDDFWTVFSEKIDDPIKLFNFLFYHKKIAKDLGATYYLLNEIENVCTGSVSSNALLSKNLIAEIYSPETLKEFLDLYKFSNAFGKQHDFLSESTANGTSLKPYIRTKFIMYSSLIMTSYSIEKMW